ncbi:major facilitator superfamily-like protein [Fragilaria crotonensis]|nr:major facilitator superfamily-like protein [Fragilaria crotonensis]
MCRRPQPSSVDLSDDCNSLEEPLLPPDQRYDDSSRSTSAETSLPSRNIRLTLMYTLIVFAGRSLWSQSVLSTFVYLLQNKDPKAVGVISAAMGLTQLFVSFPAGIFVDRYRRDYLLKVATVVGLVAIGLTYTAVLAKHSFHWLIGALSVWGVFWGISDTSLSALFADSIPDGQRSKYFTQRSILVKVGNMTGPVSALILFAFLGNEWTTQDCAIVMAFGNAICIPAVLLLACLSDDNLGVGEKASDAETEPLSSNETSMHDDSVLSNDEEQDEEQPHRVWCLLPEHRITPVLICTADVISGLGLGMSIRYFPIFFLENLKLSPILVQVLYILSPMGQAILMHFGQELSMSIGRCRTTVLFKWIGVGFMFGMIAAFHWNLPHWLVCAFFVLRTSFVNATSALTKSVLMDSVPKQERGKWSSLESVNMFGWSGSAILGGILVGSKGLLFNFIVTASIQLIATLPVLALISRDGIEGMTVEHRSRSDLSIVDDDSDEINSAV